MGTDFWTNLVIGVVIAVIAIIVIAYLLYWFYRRASQQTAFVRTGFRGRKVVRDGGSLVIPILHTIVPVNMNTMRLEIVRERDRALITKNRMRVDVTAEFYAHVAPHDDAIATAAQTLGNRTMEPERLVELIEGKFVDALRRVAAEMTMEELHEKRGEYAHRVREAVGDDLTRNGLELEAVSITQLDQTNMEYFNPSNAFDAEGLTRLTEEIERRKKLRNDIEQETLIQIRNKNLEAEKVSLEIDRESEYARLAQERELEMARASQRAEVTRERVTKDRETQEVEIAARLGVEQRRIESERALEEARIIRQREIEALEIDRRKLLEMAEQERAIAIAEKSKLQLMKQAEADAARAEAVTAAERVESAREHEIAERRKLITLVAAEEDAQREGIRLKLSAEAEKEAAGDRAAAARIIAEGDAEADKIRAVAARIRHEVDAEAARLMNEAQNVLSPDSRISNLRMRLIEKMDAIIRESVRPLEKIEGINILQVDGLGGGSGGGGGGGGSGTPTDDVINSALRYRAQAPLVDHLLREIGIENGDVKKFADDLIKPRRSDLQKQIAQNERRSLSGPGADAPGGEGPAE